MPTSIRESKGKESVASDLNEQQEKLCRFTHEHCGHPLYPNDEQWVAGLIRGGRAIREICYRVVVSAYMIEHEVSDPREARDIIKRFITGEMSHCFESFNIRRWLDTTLS